MSEPKEPEVLTFDQFSLRHGVSPVVPAFAEGHRYARRPSGAALRSWDRLVRRELEAWQTRRDALRVEYEAALAAGTIRKPARRERLEATARGTGPAAEAARRLLGEEVGS